MAAKRRVVRGVRGGQRDSKTRLKQLGLSFTSPSRFKRYWWSRDGARRIGMIFGAGALVVIATFAWFAKDLPSPSKINARIGSQNTTFYDRTGTTKIYEIHGDKNRVVVGFDKMPKNLKDATISIEDRNFYKEGAFSSIGLLRALIVDFTNRGAVQGGSTITQQYVKNALLDPTDHSVTRKIKELILSLEINQLYKKDDVLKLYLNEIPYGSQAYGVEAACRTFFNDADATKGGTCAEHLTLGQSATLSALANLPTYYSPYGEHIDELIERQNLVLDRMANQDYITAPEAAAAKLHNPGAPGQEVSKDVLVQQLALEPSPHVQTASSPYPHFAQYAKEYLEAKYGTNAVESGGLKVITSLDKDKQEALIQTLQDDPNGIASVRRNKGSNIAAVSADPKTGQVLAMMGSFDPNDPDTGQFNVALANRQPGSSFKPFVYSQLMKGNWGAGSTLYDVTTDFGGGYKPKNYSGRNYGVQSVRTALDGSLNIPAVKALHIATVPKAITNAHALGITTLNKKNPNSEYGLSLVLGSGEVKLNDMVNAYSAFANYGMHYDATPVLKVTDPRNHVLEDNTKPKGKRVLDPQIAYIMANILSDNKSRAYIFGINNPLTIAGRTVAAKTGTTEHFNDAWTMGFSPDLVTGVWVGNNNNDPMTTEAVDIAAPIWHDYMAGWTNRKTGKPIKGALSSYSTTDTWTAPKGIQTLTLDADTGSAVTKGTRRKRTDIFPSWYKPQNAAGVRTANIDTVSGKLATACTPPAAVQSVTSGQIKAEIPATDPLFNNWQLPVAALARSLGYSSSGSAIPTDNDDVHKCDDVKPTVSVIATGSDQLHITASVTAGTFPVNKLTIFFDDQQISVQTISSSGDYSVDYTPTVTGSHVVKAVVGDAGLYSGENQTTVNVTASGSGGTGSPTPFP